VAKALTALSLGVLVAVVLAGCASPAPDAKAAIFSSLRPFEDDGVATVDLDDVVPGQWTEVLLVCRGVRNATLDAALGFHWADSPDLESAGFGAMFVFSTGSTVESYANLGQDKFVANDSYVSPCPSAPAKETDTVSVIDRNDSAMTFRFDPSTYSTPTWFYLPG